MRPRRVLRDDDIGPGRPASPDDIVVRRPRALDLPPRVREREEAAAGDDDDVRGRTFEIPERDVEERPLPAPSDDDLDRAWALQRERLRAIQERERQAPPQQPPPDELRRRQEREI